MSTTAMSADTVVRVSADNAPHALQTLAAAVAEMEARLKGKAAATPYLLVVDGAHHLLGPEAPGALVRVMALANRGAAANMWVQVRGDVRQMPDSVLLATEIEIEDVD